MISRSLQRVFALTALLAASGAAHAGASPHIHRWLTFRVPEDRREDARAIAQRAGASWIRVNRLGITDIRLPADLPEPDLWRMARRLEAHPWVHWIEFPGHGEWAIQPWPALRPDDPRFAEQWHLDNDGRSGGVAGADIGAIKAWTMTSGSPDVIVAVLDSGIDLEHPDLRASIWVNPGETKNDLDDDNNGYVDDIYGWDFVNHNPDPRPTESAHGTTVAGCVAAKTHNTQGIASIAGGWNDNPGVRIMALQVGEANPESAALDDAILYAVDQGAVVITLSLSVPASQAIALAVEEARRAGVLVVCAAGNTANNVAYPATLEGIVAVSGTTREDAHWSSSARGPEVELAAPAQQILTTDLFPRYSSVNGTSFASPMVAGAAALVASYHPALPHRDDLLTALILGAQDLGPLGRDEQFGWGRLDAHGALVARRDELGHIEGTVSISADRGPDPLIRVTGRNLDFAVWAEPARGTYRLPLAANTEQWVVSTAYGHLPDSTSVAVAAGKIVRRDFSLEPAPRGTVRGRLVDERGSPAGGTVRISPPEMHPPVHTPTNFEFTLLADSVAVLTARAVLRASAPETLSVEADVVTETELSLEPVQDFDHVDGGFIAAGGVWSHGIRRAGAPLHWSAPGIWGAPLEGGYPPLADATLDTPPIVIGSTGGRATFYHQMATEAGFDGGNVKLSTDGGQTWTVVEPEQPYSLGSFPNGNVALSGESGWAGMHAWRREVIDLSPWAGETVELRWHLGSDKSVQGEGWWIDDFSLSGEAHPEIQVDLQPSTLVGVRPGDRVVLELTTSNHGHVEQSPSLTFWIDDSAVREINLPGGPLPPGKSRSVSIPAVVPDLPGGPHSLVVEAKTRGRTLHAAGALVAIR